jgi:hypothetical protein
MTPRTVPASTARPPTTPPTMAPTGAKRRLADDDSLTSEIHILEDFSAAGGVGDEEIELLELDEDKAGEEDEASTGEGRVTAR